MSKKSLVTVGMIVGSLIGGYLPSVFGFDVFSIIGILGSFVGAILGIGLGMKFGE